MKIKSYVIEYKQSDKVYTCYRSGKNPENCINKFLSEDWIDNGQILSIKEGKPPKTNLTLDKI